MTELLNNIDAPSDAELISRVRGGDVAAYGDLFSRHVAAANRLARQLMRGPDADDLVAEAFAKVLSVLQGGGGPDVAFRAYLLTAVRRLHVDRMRAGSRLQTTDDLTPFDPGIPFQDTAVEGFENGAAAKAFASLPERWQLVLWHLEVEGQKPADIAPLLGMSANSVSALAYRAREGLRQAFLTMHLSDISETDCRWVNEHLGAYVRHGLAKRDSTKVETHLESCRRCTAMYLELTEVNSNLSGIIAPLLLGAAATGYVASAGGASAAGVVSTVLGRVRDVVVGNATAATAGAVAAGVAAAAVVGISLTTGRAKEHVVTADTPIASTAPAAPSSLPTAVKPAKPATTPAAAASIPASPLLTTAPPTVAATTPALAAAVVPADQPVVAPVPPSSPVAPAPGGGSKPGNDAPTTDTPGTTAPTPTKPVPTTPAPSSPAPGSPAPSSPVPSNSPPTVPAPQPSQPTPPASTGGTSQPSAPIKVQVGVKVDSRGVSVSLSAGAGIPASFDVEVSPTAGPLTLQSSADCTVDPATPTVAHCEPTGLGAGSPLMPSSVATTSLTSFDQTIPLVVPPGQGATQVQVSVVLPDGYEAADSSSTVSFQYLPTITLDSLTQLDHTVDEAGRDSYVLEAQLTGVPHDATTVQFGLRDVATALDGTTAAGDAVFDPSQPDARCSADGAEVTCSGLSGDTTLELRVTKQLDSASTMTLALTRSPLAYLVAPDTQSLSLAPGLAFGLSTATALVGEDEDPARVHTFTLDATVAGLDVTDPAVTSVTLRDGGDGTFVDNGTCKGNANAVTCTLGADGHVHPTLSYSGDTLGTVTLTADVPVPYVDLDTATANSVSFQLVPAGLEPPEAHLGVEVAASTPEDGNDPTSDSFSLPATITGIPVSTKTVTLTIPEGSPARWETVPGCTVDGSSVTCAVTASPPDGSATFTAAVQPVLGYAGQSALPVTITVLPPEGYVDPTPDAAVAPTTLVPEPVNGLTADASLTMTGGQVGTLSVTVNGAAAGHPLTLTLDAKNSGQGMTFASVPQGCAVQDDRHVATCDSGTAQPLVFGVDAPAGLQSGTLLVSDSAHEDYPATFGQSAGSDKDANPHAPQG